MSKSAIEVITSVQRRRRWSAEEKERLVAASLEPGTGCPRWLAKLGSIQANCMDGAGSFAHGRSRQRTLPRCGLRLNRRGMECRPLARSRSNSPTARGYGSRGPLIVRWSGP
jgi:hypothetical protein